MKNGRNIFWVCLTSALLFACQKNFETTETAAAVNSKPVQWMLAGNAIAVDTVVQLAKNWNDSWSRTYPLVNGDLLFRDSYGVLLGHNVSDKPGLLSVNGESIHIDTSGNYTITLAFTDSGNYIYMIEKINFP